MAGGDSFSALGPIVIPLLRTVNGVIQAIVSPQDKLMCSSSSNMTSSPRPLPCLMVDMVSAYDQFTSSVIALFSSQQVR